MGSLEKISWYKPISANLPLEQYQFPLHEGEGEGEGGILD
jgi:hypothetical protein